MRIALASLTSLAILAGCTPNVLQDGTGGIGGAGTSNSSSESETVSSSTGLGESCSKATTCPESTNECLYPVCDATKHCGFAAESNIATCAGGTKHCDGQGDCVECIGDQDCTGPNEACSTLHTCVPSQCTDKAKDGTETDIDCGGGCPGCGNTKNCKVSGDCQSHDCSQSTKTCVSCTTDVCDSGNYCDSASGACTPTLAQGAKCTDPSQCGTGKCVEGVCCDVACASGCQSCLAANQASGGIDGTCGNVASLQDPKKVCTENASDCAAAGCNGSGACNVDAASAVCLQASCVNDTLHQQTNCDGVHASCPTQTQAPCSGHYSCNATATACRTVCAGNGAIPGQISIGCGAGYSCDVTAHACIVTASKATGDDCTNNYECMSNDCEGSVCV